MNASKTELQNFINDLLRQRDEADSAERESMFDNMITGCLLTLDALRVPYKTETNNAYEYTKIELI